MRHVKEIIAAMKDTSSIEDRGPQDDWRQKEPASVMMIDKGIVPEDMMWDAAWEFLVSYIYCFGVGILLT